MHPAKISPLVIALLASSALAQPTLTFIPIVRALGISADGNAVSGIYANGLAARWTRSGGTQIIGTNYSEGTAISADGNVIAGRGINSSGVGYSFRWTAATGTTPFATLPGEGGAAATGTTADGAIIVGTSFSPDFSTSTAFRWTAATGTQPLDIPPGPTGSTAAGISADGTTIVGTASSLFRLTASTLETLPMLPGDTLAYTAYYTSVSADGRYVAGSGDLSPIRWDPSGAPLALGVPDGFDLAESTAISGDGQTVVGIAYAPDLTSSPYYWTPSTGPLNLTTYLQSLGADLTGYTLSEALAVSYDGSTLVAFGGYNNFEGSIVITNIPEPHTAAVLALATLLTTRRPRRQNPDCHIWPLSHLSLALSVVRHRGCLSSHELTGERKCASPPSPLPSPSSPFSP